MSICESNPQKYEQDQIKSVSNSKKSNKISKKQQSNNILDFHPISNQYYNFQSGNSFIIYLTVNIQMRGQYHDKENHHPNIIRQGGKIKEVDFSAISRAYVLEGDRLKVKSIYYNDKMRQPKMSMK